MFAGQLRAISDIITKDAMASLPSNWRKQACKRKRQSQRANVRRDGVTGSGIFLAAPPKLPYATNGDGKMSTIVSKQKCQT